MKTLILQLINTIKIHSFQIVFPLLSAMIIHFWKIDKRQYLEDRPVLKAKLDFIAHEIWFHGFYRFFLVYFMPISLIFIAIIQPPKDSIVSPIYASLIFCIIGFGNGLLFTYFRKKMGQTPNPWKN